MPRGRQPDSLATSGAALARGLARLRAGERQPDGARADWLAPETRQAVAYAADLMRRDVIAVVDARGPTEAAALLGVSRDTVYAWTAGGWPELDEG